MNAFRDSESYNACLLLKHSNFKQSKFTANNASFFNWSFSIDNQILIFIVVVFSLSLLRVLMK